MLNTEERKAKVRKLIIDLSARFDELLWSHPSKLSALRKLRPSFMEQFDIEWNELDKRCAEYIVNDIPWAGDGMQMDFSASGFAVPKLAVDRDIECYARDLFCWVVLGLKDL